VYVLFVDTAKPIEYWSGTVDAPSVRRGGSDVSDTKNNEQEEAPAVVMKQQNSKAAEISSLLTVEQLGEIRLLMKSCNIVLDDDMLHFLKWCKVS